MLPRPANRQSDDIAAGLMPFVKYSIATDNERLERMRSERDFAVRSFRLEKDKPAPQLQIRGRFRKITMSVHPSPSPLDTSEHGKDDGRSGIVKPLKALTASVCRINGATNRAIQVPDAANDNELPREAEAA